MDDLKLISLQKLFPIGNILVLNRRNMDYDLQSLEST